MTINPTPLQVIERHKARNKTLELALKDAREEQKHSLQAELNRRKNELEQLKKALED
jgi:hypothetical protein